MTLLEDLIGAASRAMAGRHGVGDISSVNERTRGGRRAAGLLASMAAALLLVGSGCGVLDLDLKPTPVPTRSADQITPPVVVTVGGVSADATPTPGTAPTIPDSTPLPLIALPTRDPAAAAAAPSPAVSRNVSAAARAAQPPPAAAPVGRSSPTPSP